MALNLGYTIMKEFEYIGVMTAMVAYTLITMGHLQLGFTLGILSSTTMFAYFMSIKSYATVGLQLFFICANMFGLYNLGVI